MARREEDSDSDAPEEFTSEQGIQQDEEITKVQRENKARVVREGKERRRQWAQKITPRPSHGDKSIQNDTETPQESDDNRRMLPDDIVKLLAAQEKKVFLSDSEEEKTEKGRTSRKKKPRNSGFTAKQIIGNNLKSNLEIRIDICPKSELFFWEVAPPLFQLVQKALEFFLESDLRVYISSYGWTGVDILELVFVICLLDTKAKC